MNNNKNNNNSLVEDMIDSSSHLLSYLNQQYEQQYVKFTNECRHKFHFGYECKYE